ncbi:MAG: FeoA family protein [Candidatus Omnitrophica bacterium]|nr:FeoA family protein [Candidatus Omnitrophota bacterium]
MLIDITGLKPQEEGLVKDIHGGDSVVSRMQNMGIRIGKKIKKVSAHFCRGPQTVEIDNFQIALGYGMAKKIIVEVSR